ncbi:MAG: hypothetical protein DMD45_05450 [Gemmatimonadetes bacterium]|nr:MAG: hypothetical protein DMD45_05450 [Gemmatimonadota bacterium]
MHDPTSPRRISSPSAFPGPSRCSWPRNSSRRVGRMRAARGSAERENRVGSDTGKGKREMGNVLHENIPRPQHTDAEDSRTRLYRQSMRQLESLDAWRTAQELAEAAYRLTMTSPLDRHFGLIDQIRRAAVSVPANMAEGYALSTTAQFIRCLRISLGSAAELRTHLDLVRRLKLADDEATTQAVDLCTRVVSMVVGLLRKLGQRSRSRFPFPVSRFPTTRADPTASS